MSAAFRDPVGEFLSAGSGGSASRTSAATRAEIHGAGQAEPEVDLDGLHLFDEFLVDDVLEPLDIENLVGIFWLIQSQCQRGAASAAGIEKYPDG